MNEPAIEVLGVYRLTVTDELVRAQCSILYSTDLTGADRRCAEAQVRTQLEDVVLIEVLVRARDERFDVDDFAQPRIDSARENWQAAWAEACLTHDGDALEVERWSRLPTTGELRLAFFIHDWRRDLPLCTSYGNVPCPEPQPMPQRLERLVPYELLD